MIESVELAEELAGEAEEEGERRREDLRQAVNSVDEASLALAEVARLVDQALQVYMYICRCSVLYTVYVMCACMYTGGSEC